MSVWYSPAPVQVPENVQKPETVLYGPRGEVLVIRQPRTVGFRPPAAPTLPLGTPVTVERPAGAPADQPPPDAVVALR